MRFLLATATLVVGLAGTTGVHAQNVSDPATALVDCAGDSVATNVAGDAIPADALPVAPVPAHDLPADLCTDARDPRCAPLTPSRDAPGSAAHSDIERFLGNALAALPLVSVVVLPSPEALDPSSEDGPSGVRSYLDRPPRSL